jgi:hypothetical protein
MHDLREREKEMIPSEEDEEDEEENFAWFDI